MEYLGHTIEILRNPMPWNIPTYQICGNIKNTSLPQKEDGVLQAMCLGSRGKAEMIA